MTITRQYLVDALIESIEKSLCRLPVKQGITGGEHYLFRREAANNAIKMVGGEVGLFQDKAEVRAKMDFDDLSDEQLLIRLAMRPRRCSWRGGRLRITATKVDSIRTRRSCYWGIAVRAKANQK